MNRIRISRSTAVALIVGGDLLLLVCGWFMLVSPQRSTAQSIARSAQATEVQVEQTKAAAQASSSPTTQPKQPEIRTAYLYKLSKAMPMTTDMPNLLLQVSQAVKASGVELTSVQPATDAATGTTTVTLQLFGDFYSLTDLLYRLRSLVAVHDGLLDVSGPLFAVKNLTFAPVGVGNILQSTVQLNTFTFGAAAQAASASAAAAAAVATAGGTTTGTTTTGTTTTASADTGVGAP